MAADILDKRKSLKFLYGHHTKERVLAAMWGGVAFTATQVTGIESPDLPFRPTGWVI